MRPGTPGFSGSRLREAIEVRGKTAAWLAGHVDVSAQAVSKYERGKATPGPTTLRKIAHELEFPIRFFLAGDRSRSSSPVFFRSMAAATKRARAAARHQLIWLQDLSEALAVDVRLPEPNLPSIDVGDPLLLSFDEIEEVASEVRTFWRMGSGPVPNMINLLENQGVVSAKLKLGANTLDGVSVLDAAERRGYVIVGTDKGASCRWRFDAAHELGHLVLHSEIDNSSLMSSAHFKLLEDQAHRFAAAFLLPMEAFGDELVGLNLDSFLALKPSWKVSVAMMMKRSSDLGFVPDEEALRKLHVSYGRRKWRTNEPYDNEIAGEDPSLIRNALLLLGREAPGRDVGIVEELGLPVADVERLAGLEPGTLRVNSGVAMAEASAASLAPIPEQASLPGLEREETRPPAKVIQLPVRR